jgi:hypothetical protein
MSALALIRKYRMGASEVSRSEIRIFVQGLGLTRICPGLSRGDWQKEHFRMETSSRYRRYPSRNFGVETRLNERCAGQGDGAAVSHSPPWPFTVKSAGWTGS